MSPVKRTRAATALVARLRVKALAVVEVLVLLAGQVAALRVALVEQGNLLRCKRAAHKPTVAVAVDTAQSKVVVVRAAVVVL